MTEYLPKPDYAFINVGKDIKVSPSLVNEWQPDNFLNRFVSTRELAESDCCHLELSEELQIEELFPKHRQ